MGDKGETEFLIQKMPDGGFLVLRPGGERYCGPSAMFASTSIEEALKYIKGKLSVAKP